MKEIPVNRVVRALPHTVPFVGPESLERTHGVQIDLRLGANESLWGPSPLVYEALREANPSLYGDPEGFDLRAAISVDQQVDFDEVMLGEGIDGLFSIFARAAFDPTRKVVMADGSYPTFPFVARTSGCEIVKVPYRGSTVDVDGLADAVRQHDATWVYLANPDNPTGSAYPENTVLSWFETLPESCHLVLDEAYVDTAPNRVLPMIHPRILRLRTFSKLYGLAGMRVGYVLASREWLQAFQSVRLHFGVNRLGQIAARSALQDSAYLHRVRAELEVERTVLSTGLRDLGLRPYESWTNFLLCPMDSVEQARALVAALLAKGVFVRTPAPGCHAAAIRVSIGPNPTSDQFLERLRFIVQKDPSLLPRIKTANGYE
jgi:histidinol-phosphate aminotransferase